VRKHNHAYDKHSERLAAPVPDFSALQAQALKEDPQYRVPYVGSGSAPPTRALIELIRPSHRRHRPPRHVAGPVDRGPSLHAVPFGLASTNTVIQILSDPQRLQLAGIATRLRLPAGTILYRQDSIADWVFIVSHGVAKTFHRLPSGKRRVLAFMFEGDVFGLAECGRYVNTVQSLTPIGSSTCCAETARWMCSFCSRSHISCASPSGTPSWFRGETPQVDSQCSCARLTSADVS